jgi:hypothetical protein
MLFSLHNSILLYLYICIEGSKITFKQKKLCLLLDKQLYLTYICTTRGLTPPEPSLSDWVFELEGNKIILLGHLCNIFSDR